jgi:hypothetical protein
MKRSELKEAIKNEITSVLLEGMSDEERENRIQHLMRTGAKEKPLRKLAAIGKEDDMHDDPGDIRIDHDYYTENLKEGKRGVVVDPDEIKYHLDQFYGGNIDGNDLANAIEEILSDMMNKSVTFSDIREAEYTDRVGKSRLASNKYKQADEFNKSYDSVAQAAAEKQFDDDVMDKAASKRAKKEPIGKEAERLAQVQKFMKQMQDKGIVGKDKKILDTPKYKEEFAKFKAGLKNKF